MTQPMRLENCAAVVTGAASGIGQAIAVSLVRRGCHVALADLNEEGLRETERLAGVKARVTRHRLDVADRPAVAAFPQFIVDEHGRVDLLVNNAGVALGRTFEEIAEDDFEWLIDINFWGVVRMTRAFLPALKASDDARIVNLSSMFGLIAPAGRTAYAASKFAVRGFSNALMAELQGSSVSVTVVHPGGVATKIADNARAAKRADPERTAAARALAKKTLTLPPETAGEIIVKAVERRRPRVLVGRDAHLIALLERLAPVSSSALIARLAWRQ